MGRRPPLSGLAPFVFLPLSAGTSGARLWKDWLQPDASWPSPTGGQVLGALPDRPDG